MGDSISAQVTTTFVGYKQGLFLNAGPECSGEVFFSNLNIPEECYQSAEPTLTFVTEELSKKVLTKRPIASHKGNFGHILVVGGNHGMGGAVRIAAEAALRSGAGLVSVATRKSNVPIVAKLRPEGISRESMGIEDWLVVWMHSRKIPSTGRFKPMPNIASTIKSAEKLRL